ncbi:hypothetical protein [Exiguobacterium mexicanum]|uniref:hypothetical protein n=1 Tax=Exiguobacterium mexicanum TaxID=340146 RepID=UPI0037BF67B4
MTRPTIPPAAVTAMPFSTPRSCPNVNRHIALPVVRRASDYFGGNQIKVTERRIGRLDHLPQFFVLTAQVIGFDRHFRVFRQMLFQLTVLFINITYVRNRGHGTVHPADRHREHSLERSDHITRDVLVPSGFRSSSNRNP